jgi:putative ABC transport system permease protein
MRSWMTDLRVAARALARNPAFSVASIVTLALGIGATTALVSVVHGVLLRPLPYPAADRLVRLGEVRGAQSNLLGTPSLSNLTFLAWKDTTRTLDSLFPYSSRAFIVASPGGTVRETGHAVGVGLLESLGGAPALGRTFLPGEDAPSAERTVVLSDALWRRAFGARDDIIGHVVDLDGQPATVVGVMPPSFAFPSRDTQLWTPLVVSAAGTKERLTLMIFPVLGRLAPGATPEQVAAEGTVVAAAAAAGVGLAGNVLFGGSGDVRVLATPLLEEVTRRVRPALLVLLAAVALLLLAACASAGNLWLARAASRQHELALRSALGAGRWRLGRLLLAECLIVSLAGALAGVAWAWVLLAALPSMAPLDFPRLEMVGIDARAFALASLLGIGAAFTFGLAPAWQAMRTDLRQVVDDVGARSAPGFGRSAPARLRSGLMVAEVALAVVLLAGATLLTRSFLTLMAVNPGYDATNVLTAQVSFPRHGYPPERMVAFTDALLSRMAAQTDVTAAGMADRLPLSPGGAAIAYNRPGAVEASGEPEVITAALRIATPGYLRAMGIRVVDGRPLNERDVASSSPAVLVNQTFARRYLPASPVGTVLPGLLAGPTGEWEVVGVVADVRRERLEAEPEPEVYVSIHQFQDSRGLLGSTVTFAFRTEWDPAALAPRLREFVREIDPALPLHGVLTMEQRVAAAVAGPRLYTSVLALFAACAVLLAAVGIYGLLAYAVTQRRREIGVRTALGATRTAILAMVMRQGLTLVGAGLALGLLAAWLLRESVASLLYGITPADPLTFVVVAVVLLAVGLLACGVPAARAARLDPVEALRSE